MLLVRHVSIRALKSAKPTRQLPASSFSHLLSRRSLTTAFSPSKPDSVQVPVGSSGSITLDIYHPPRPTPATPVIIHLPPGPLSGASPLDKSSTTTQVEPSTPAILASASNATVVSLHYRLSPPTILYPQPVHDVLAGYDWVAKHLLSLADASARIAVGKLAENGTSAADKKKLPGIGICGELVGGSLAAALALTECRITGPAVKVAALANPVADWSAMPEIPASLGTAKPEEKSTRAGKKGRKKKNTSLASDSWSRSAQVLTSSDPLSAASFLAAKKTLFPSQAAYFDPFASPLLFFRTPVEPLEEPAKGGPRQDDDPLAELDVWFAQLEEEASASSPGSLKKAEEDEGGKGARRYARRHPPSGSGLELPPLRFYITPDGAIADQSMELARLVAKGGAEEVEAREKSGALWTVDEASEVGSWMGGWLWRG